MLILRTHDDVQQAAGGEPGLGGVLVPTMGALHAGHEALIRRGAQLARTRDLKRGCVVSIFVNPTQFNDPGDLERYPRTLEADLEITRRAGAAVVFAPDLETMYPAAQPVQPPPLPPVALSPGLEDAYRPGHFAGVCQVVMRLFRLLEPVAAVFGEKDWQQLQVLRAMTSGASLPIEIVSHPTVRDPDGLAMSSRNRFLSAEERAAALAIPRALAAAGAFVDAGEAEAAMGGILSKADVATEYAVVRDAVTLGPVTSGDCSGRALVAARVGGIRLIDNAAWPAAGKADQSSRRH